MNDPRKDENYKRIDDQKRVRLLLEAILDALLAPRLSLWQRLFGRK